MWTGASETDFAAHEVAIWTAALEEKPLLAARTFIDGLLEQRTALFQLVHPYLLLRSPISHLTKAICLLLARSRAITTTTCDRWAKWWITLCSSPAHL
jgi:hypothetical protein